MIVLSVDPLIEVSQETLDYLLVEYKWIKEDRPDGYLDWLDELWYKIDQEGIKFLDDRGQLMGDKDGGTILIWENGNGYQNGIMASAATGMCAGSTPVGVSI